MLSAQKDPMGIPEELIAERRKMLEMQAVNNISQNSWKKRILF